ncbi:MAG: amino acid adenylation domain-containing protein [Bacteroidales bacterium]|nr:amino acid adenylation domain-containing protein [Bacteroidales bacterium]MBN2821177.1 amino acid adenylation domain-containing protein [Bacteroidales bacterium]
MIAEKCIHHVFEEQVKQTPDNIAVKFQESTLTYGELNNYTNALANQLIAKNVQIEDFILVYMDRRLELMVSIYGVLKAGGVYVPVSGDYPQQRFLDIIEDTKAKVLITEEKYLANIPEGIETIVIDSFFETVSDEEYKRPNVDVKSNNLAYAIFTSGSTGKPKGVLIEHHSVINRIEWMQKEYPINSSDIILQKTTITFDVSIWELFWWSFVGASQVLLPNTYEKSPEKLFDCVVKEKVTVMHFVPSMFNVSLSYLKSIQLQNKLNTLKWIFCSGEELLPNSVSDFYELSSVKQNNETVLVNLYGPTEATVDVTYYTCPKEVPSVIPIGKPIDNTQIYIIDESNQILPPNAEGELVICGVNLARGYLNREELTAEKFIYIDNNNQKVRAYKSGDKAFIDNNGDIIYKGRFDTQVKIRGFRIELGEIENRVIEIEGIKESACILDKAGTIHAQIICYYSTELNKSLEIEFKKYLEDKLPQYMIPSKFIKLEDMPRTISGKIDRKNLPAPDKTPVNKKTKYSGELENQILEVWREVLEIENIDTNDNFFDIGGNSLLVPFVSEKLKSRFGVDLKTLDVFQFPTVNSLVKQLIRFENIEKQTVSINDTMDSADKNTESKIAIIGLAGKFPDSETAEEFWQNMLDKKELIQVFDDEILRRVDSTYEKNKDNPNYIKSRGILKDIELWDARFFGWSDHDARYTDPQQRIWFEQVWYALEDAGYDPFNYSGDIGVFAGVNLNSYLFDNILRDRKIYEDYMHFGDAETFQTYVNNDPAFIATRTSYLFNLKGPAINVQSACSTALMSIIQACNSLKLGESDMAIAGAVSVQTPQELGYIYQKGGMRSADGHCRPFDKDASGTVFSNAVGVVVLKRLDDAIRDNDNIYATIRGWAINNDGNDKIGFAAPGVNGQANLHRKAHKNAKVHPEDIKYIEAHGTGTVMGDPIEVTALTQAFSERTSKKQYCGIGSSKSNIGHTDEVAGMAGFLKIVLSAYHGKIPGTINYKESNPEIDFENTPFYVTTDTLILDEKEQNILGVSSFGVGSTNTHILIEDYKRPLLVNNEEPAGEFHLIVTSGKNYHSLKANIDNLKGFIQENENVKLADVAYTSQLRRAHFPKKAFVVADDKDQIISENFQTGEHSNKRKKLIFLFPGQGAQYINMGKSLYEKDTLFKEWIDKGFDAYKNITGKSLKSIIFDPIDPTLINNTEYTQPALFIFSYAITKIFEKYSIIPDATIGHSIGEYTSACLAGVFDFETGLKIVIRRGELMQSVETGSMMAVRVGYNELQGLNSDLFEIAADNAPKACTISFRTENKVEIEGLLASEGIDFINLKTSHAFHSSQFDIILDKFEDYVNTFSLNKSIQIPFISCLTGEYADEAKTCTGKYWASQLRNTVNYSKGIRLLQENVDCVFSECGPNEHLSGLTRQNLDPAKKIKIISTLGRDNSEDKLKVMLESVGNLWLAGCPVNFNPFHQNPSRSLIKLPKYAFDKKRYWLEIDRQKLEKNIQNELKVVIETESDLGIVNINNNELNNSLSPVEKELFKIWSSSLGTAEIDKTDNFFELGGHSLMAVQIISSINSLYNTEISLDEFLKNESIEELAKIVESAQTNGDNDKRDELPLIQKAPLSRSQKRVWILSNLTPDNPCYNVPYLYEFNGNLDTRIFKQALSTIFKRHTILSSRIYEENKTPHYETRNEEVSIEEIDLSGISASEKEKQLQELTISKIRTPFNLGGDKLYRFSLVRFNNEKFYFIAVFNHLIFDGWSWWVFINEFNAAYKQIKENNPLNLSAITKSHFQFALSEGESIRPEIAGYWKSKMAGVPGQLNLPYDKKRPAVNSGLGTKIPFNLTGEQSVKLRALSKSGTTTLFNTLLTAYSILLNKYTHDTDFCIGSYFNERPNNDYRNSMGMFVNTLVLRILINTNERFADLLNNIKKTTLEAMTNQPIGFDDIVNIVKPPRQFNINPIFQTVFAWHGDAFSTITHDDFVAESVSLTKGISPFDLTLNMWEKDGIIEGDFEFNEDIFTDNTIFRLKENFIALINQLVTTTNCSIKNINVISQEEKLAIDRYNSTYTKLPDDDVPRIFEKIAHEQADKIALICGDNTITYRHLDENVNKLANYLISKQIKSNDTIGICVDRSIDMVICMLASLKLGATYLPLDPDFPEDRLNFMVEDSEAKIILTQPHHLTKFEENSAMKVLYTYTSAEFKSLSGVLGLPAPDRYSNAYILYTSGSTGKPKGVKIHHEALTNFLVSMAVEPGFDKDDILLAVTTISFDISILELFLPLIKGGIIVLAESRDVLDGNRLVNLIEKYNVSFFQATPGRWNIMLQNGWKGKHNLKALVGGEPLPTQLIDNLLPKVKELWNMYGPTETTIWSTIKKIETSALPVLVGKPIYNTIIKILSDDNIEMPIGSIGEVCIGGLGVAKGYHKREELTKEKFIQLDNGELYYKTGDKGRIRSDLELELFGRIDNQVKIRGYRVEPSEIEKLLNKITGVEESIVKVYKFSETDERLVAFLNTNHSFTESKDSILKTLRKDLPEYMVPSSYYIETEFPRTPNGKIDRKLLKINNNELQNTDSVTKSFSKNDFSAIELKIKDIWKEHLKVDNIGKNENFFDIGGTSLTLLEVVKDINKLVEKEIDIIEFFDNTTIKSISTLINSVTEKNQEIAEKQSTSSRIRDLASKRRNKK